MTWLITGASRGLGRHLALQLAQRGHRVLACARDAERLQTLAAESGGAVVPVVVDLADAAQIGPRLSAAIAGEAHLSGVVNNAGFGVYKPFLEHSEAESIQLVQVNLTAAIQVCHAVLPRLLAQGRGHIVNVGSDLARRPLANMAVYAAAKHGLAGFSHSLLREVKAAGVKVSLVNSGIVDTDFGGAAEGSRDAHWSLRPAQLAQLIVQLIEQPGNVVVDELSVHPLGQDF
ncbi:MAG TPA: SDR family NAD(P)-dependent oxidoreductase [Burkholderiaceae bacterium]|nr:SDR family NAD(P)-dependent oxidoreductase [Burkholderiaceae bacterium]